MGAELDGSIHDEQKAEDAQRDEVLSEMGLRIIRIKNGEIERNLAAVLKEIRSLL